MIEPILASPITHSITPINDHSARVIRPIFDHLGDSDRRATRRAPVVHRRMTPRMKAADTEAARFALGVVAALVLLAAFIAVLHAALR